MRTMNEVKRTVHPILHEETLTVHHKSGLTVYLTPKKMQSAYAVLSVGYGSLHTRFENQDGKTVQTPSGIAHFLEHKLFEMPDGSDAFERFAAIGANANAYTTPSRTSYLFSCTAHFEEALEILIRMVFTPHFTDASVRREAEIIKQEINSYEDQPSSRLFRAMMHNLFEKHGLREGICGTPESIGRITPALLSECYRAFYVTSNMVLSVSGDISEVQITRVLDRVLGELSFRKEPAARTLPIHERGQVGRTHTELSMSVARPILQVGIKDTFYREDKLFMTRRHLLMNIVLNAVCGAGSSLYEELLEGGLVQDKPSTDYSDEAGCAYAIIAAESDEPSLVTDILYRELDRMAKCPPDEAEFERLRRCVYADFMRLFDSTEEIAEEMLDNFFTGVDLLDVADIILSLKYEEMTALIRELFKPEHYTSAFVLPLDKKEEASQ